MTSNSHPVNNLKIRLTDGGENELSLPSSTIEIYEIGSKKFGDVA